jgi:hypothetical protein
MVIVEIIISIVDFLGFNGFIRVSQQYKDGHGFQGTLGLIVSIIYILLAVLSSIFELI